MVSASATTTEYSITADFLNLRVTFVLFAIFRRYAWLLLYLLGSAPAVYRSFVANLDHKLSPVGKDSHSLHQPFATSLRMGDLGYQSQAQSNVDVSYNSLG